ncbi:hypothetical protein B0A50_03182 [Salinomyces thailandicus]|uniref:Transcription factor Iwr1 domain-containing protein n=1 Tax=Salinomyces thailandicus TaxID=706561 RepID=A0A4U0U4C6_9PEZI|nr:hypothetical protein B0A50_03182 [Salinomyces thailandica]
MPGDMHGPNELRLKRKRNEPAPDTLVLEPQPKRAFTDEARQLQYVRQEVKVNRETATRHESSQEPHQHALRNQVQAKEASQADRRVFHLASAKPPSGIHKAKKINEKSVATFVERLSSTGTSPRRKIAPVSQAPKVAPPAGPQACKRPGRASAVPKSSRMPASQSVSEDVPQPKLLDGLADELHQFALAEIAESQKPKITALPKLSAVRSRDLHRQKTAATVEDSPQLHDVEMADGDEGEYVYDTYVLASGRTMEDLSSVSDGTIGDVGYLVITDEDKALWEAYIEDEPSDRDWDTDDEDENAEDYYAADYPEDELASDDEYGRNAYGYRKHGGSDDEEWDEDTGAYSGDEEPERSNLWNVRKPKQLEAIAGEDDSN